MRTFGYIGGSVEGYPYWGGSIGSYTTLGVDLNDLHRAAEALLDRAILDVEDEAEGVEIERQVIQGPAAEVLVQLLPGMISWSSDHAGTAASPACCWLCQPAMRPSRAVSGRRRPLAASQRRLAARRLPAHKLPRRPDSAT